MKKGGVFYDPIYIIDLKWDKIKMYKSKKENKMIYNIRKFTSDSDIERSFNFKVYDEIVRQSNNKAYAFIITLLFQKSVCSIKLKDKTIKLKFTDDTSISIDILNYELDNYVNDIIRIAVSNYRKNCVQEIKNNLKSNEKSSIKFHKTLSYESNYKKNENNIEFTCMTRGDVEFGLNESEFVLNVIKTFLDNEDEPVMISKKMLNFDNSNSLIVNPTTIGIVIYGKNKSISIMNNIDFVKVLDLVKEHNKKINGTEYYKVRRSK